MAIWENFKLLNIFKLLEPGLMLIVKVRAKPMEALTKQQSDSAPSEDSDQPTLNG